MSVRERLLAYLKPMRKSLVVAVVFSLLYVAAQIAQPFLLGKALDSSITNDRGAFNAFVFVALALVILGTVFAFLFSRDFCGAPMIKLVMGLD